MTMNHDFATLLARSKRGEGTLQYDVDERGVHFSFDAPNTDDGDRALELVRRGDIDGCSFMFSCSYRTPDVTSETTKTRRRERLKRFTPFMLFVASTTLRSRPCPPTPTRK